MLTLLDESLHAKNYDITWFFPVVLKIKESCNMIGQEEQLALPNQK